MCIKLRFSLRSPLLSLSLSSFASCRSKMLHNPLTVSASAFHFSGRIVAGTYVCLFRNTNTRRWNARKVRCTLKFCDLCDFTIPSSETSRPLPRETSVIVSCSFSLLPVSFCTVNLNRYSWTERSTSSMSFRPSGTMFLDLSVTI